MDITNIIEAIITLLVAIITTFLIPYLKSKVDTAKLEKIKSWVKVAVEAAEQIYTENGKGKEKKQYVLTFLESKGYIIDEESIDTLIESSVLVMNKQLE